MAISSCTINDKTDPVLGFVKFYGDAVNEFAADVKVDPQGDYIMIGTTASNGNGSNDIILIKSNKQGNKLWEKYFGTVGSDTGVAVIVTSDGGYLLLGNSSTIGGTNYTESILIKTDSEGNEQWNKRISSGLGSVYGHTIIETTDGSFVFGGSLRKLPLFRNLNDGESNFLALKLDSDGDIIGTLNNRAFEGFDNYFNNIFEASNNQFRLIGNKLKGLDRSMVYVSVRPSSGDNLIYTEIAQIDKNSSLVAEPSIDVVFKTIITTDGGYISIGRCIKNNNFEDTDVFILKTNSEFTKEWYRTYSFADLGQDRQEIGYDILQNENGSFTFIASKQITDSDLNIVIAQIDKEGNLQWNKQYGGSGIDIPVAIVKSNERGYLVLSTMDLVTNPVNRQVIGLIKVDQMGDIKN
jgi:hypothetical protein